MNSNREDANLYEARFRTGSLPSPYTAILNVHHGMSVAAIAYLWVFCNIYHNV